MAHHFIKAFELYATDRTRWIPSPRRCIAWDSGTERQENTRNDWSNILKNPSIWASFASVNGRIICGAHQPPSAKLYSIEYKSLCTAKTRKVFGRTTSCFGRVIACKDLRPIVERRNAERAYVLPLSRVSTTRQPVCGKKRLRPRSLQRLSRSISASGGELFRDKVAKLRHKAGFNSKRIR